MTDLAIDLPSSPLTRVRPDITRLPDIIQESLRMNWGEESPRSQIVRKSREQQLLLIGKIPSGISFKTIAVVSVEGGTVVENSLQKRLASVIPHALLRQQQRQQQGEKNARLIIPVLIHLTCKPGGEKTCKQQVYNLWYGRWNHDEKHRDLPGGLLWHIGENRLQVARLVNNMRPPDQQLDEEKLEDLAASIHEGLQVCTCISNTEDGLLVPFV